MHRKKSVLAEAYANMQQQIETCLDESRYAMARTLVVRLPPEAHAAWLAAIEILQHARDDPKRAMALVVDESGLNEAVVRKAFK